jgi:hypothetical protein
MFIGKDWIQMLCSWCADTKGLESVLFGQPNIVKVGLRTMENAPE